MKRFVVLVVLIAFLGVCFADSISDYQVSSDVPLNQKITATGIYSGDVNDGIKCSFYFFDLNNNLVYRATDQYTVATGRFTMTGVTLVEPLFVRGETYSLHSECGSATVDANFGVGQKQETFDFFGFKFYPQGTMLDLLYFRDNSFFLLSLFVVVMVVVGVVVIALQNFGILG